MASHYETPAMMGYI